MTTRLALSAWNWTDAQYRFSRMPQSIAMLEQANKVLDREAAMRH